MLYPAKCDWPAVTETKLREVAHGAQRADSSPSRDGVAYIGALLFSADELVFCLFEGPSRSAVRRVSDRLGIPCERLMDSVWLQPDRATTKGAEH
jgi:hypothetical protein